MGKTSQCLTLQVLDRRMDMNPNYEEATMALNFNPEDMGASPPSERQAWFFLLGRCGRLSWVVNAHGNALRTNPDLQKFQNEELGGLGDQDQSAGSAVWSFTENGSPIHFSVLDSTALVPQLGPLEISMCQVVKASTGMSLHKLRP